MSLRIPNPFNAGENWQYYDAVYGELPFSGKSVLDLGADVGSTVDYFLQKGARLVYAVEGSDKIFYRLERNVREVLKDPDHIKVRPIHLYVKDAQVLALLLNDLRPDIVKHDLNGWGQKFEHFICELPSVVVKVARHWLIEAHSEDADRFLRAYFEGNNYSLVRKVKTVLYFRFGK